MNEPHDPNRTVDVPASEPADSLDAGLAAGFGKSAQTPRSSLDASQRPVLLKEAQGESNHIVKPNSDAMPQKSEAGDRYQLFGEIARGGMGAVLRGRDVDLGRDLAVKVLLEKHTNRPEVAQRFLEEAQIGGQLQHPNVVPVYDIGRFGERPFFTMKLVKGLTLAALLAERTDPAVDRPRFLADFLKVAQAMAYAHAKGVIHRDLKPANIMVGTFGEVQVMDWGLAKVLAEGGVADEERASRLHQPEVGTMIRTARSGSSGHGTDTEAGTLLGTPAYMPPEQANGDVANLDRRCDVFGLGAILCEILTGKPPYVGRSAEEVRRKAANGDLGDAHARLDGCSADNELIALTRACLSPEANDRPRDAQAVADALTAYADGVQERLHQAELAEAAARAKAVEEVKRRRLTLALASTMLLAVLGAAVGTSLYLMQAEKARGDAALRAAAERERLGRNAEAVAGLLDQAEKALRTSDAVRAEVLLEAAGKRADEGGAEGSSGRRDRLEADLAVLNELDKVDRFRLTVARNKLPDSVVVATRTRHALKRFGVDPNETPEDEVVARVSASAVRRRIVSALDRLLPHPKAVGARAVLRRVDPDTYRGAVRDAILANDWAKVVALAGQKAALEQPSGFAAFLGETNVIGVQRRRQLLQAAVARRPGDLGLLLELGNSYGRRKDEVDAQLRWYQAAVAAAPANAVAHNNLGNALLDKGQRDEAITCFERAIELGQKFAIAHFNLGVALLAKREVDEAIARFHRAIELDPEFGGAHTNLGKALADKGQMDRAIACFHRALKLDPKDAHAHVNLGNALHGKGQVDEAIAYARKAIAIDPESANAYTNLGNALIDKGEVDKAIACHKRAIAIDQTLALAHYNLGNALGAKGQLDEAIACFEKAIELDPKDPYAHNNLGSALLEKGDLDEAITSYKKALAINRNHASAHNGMGIVLVRKGRLDEAIACFRKTLAIVPNQADTLTNLGHALADKGQLDEAITSYKKALAIDQKFAATRAGLAWAERMLEARDRLTAYQKGSYAPATAEEHLLLAEWCKVKKFHRTAAGLYAAAFALDPKLADDVGAGHRYNAASHAALAAGQGEERLALRRRALTWLRADLASWSRLFALGEVGRTRLTRILTHWQKDAALSGVRDAGALEAASAEERAACARLWADVAALLKKAERK